VASLINQCRPEELGCNACKCLSIIELVLRVRRDFENYVDRSLVDVDNELVYKSLIGGLKDDGTFAENAVANFIKDLFRITIEDPRRAAAFLKIDVKPKVRVVKPEPSLDELRSTPDIQVLHDILYSLMEDLGNTLNYIIKGLSIECDKLGTRCQSNIEYPREPSDLVKLFTSFLNDCAVRFLPQFRDNACVTIAFHTAQLTRRYLEAVSRSTNHELGGVLDRKDIIELLGLQEILDLKGFGLGEEWSLWGYPDCLTYDEERGVTCLNMKRLETLGGAINKAVIINKAILEVLRELNTTKWFKIPNTYYDDNVNQVLSKVKLKPYINELLKQQSRALNSGSASPFGSSVFTQSTFIIKYIMGLFGLLKLNKEYFDKNFKGITKEIDKGTAVERSESYSIGMGYKGKTILSLHRYSRLKKYPDTLDITSESYYPSLVIDNDGFVHFRFDLGDIIHHDLGIVHVKEFLYDAEPLMFLRVLNPIFTGDNRVFLVTSYFNIPMSG
jgi:hypothetical protein